MLETGNGGWAKGSNQSDVEYRTEFSMWAILASPMVVTTPLNNMHGAGNGFFEPFLGYKYGVFRSKTLFSRLGYFFNNYPACNDWFVGVFTPF